MQCGKYHVRKRIGLSDQVGSGGFVTQKKKEGEREKEIKEK